MATPSRAPESPTFYGPAAGEAYRRPFRTRSFPGRRLNQPEELPPLPSWHGGKELVDIANREELYGVMEEH